MSQMNEQTTVNECACGCECEKPMLDVPVKGVSIRIDPEALKPCNCEKYDLCEFYYFRRPWLKPGFELADGKLLENAAVLYPRAWAFLQTPEGRELCATEEEWQAMNHADWATLADGTKIGWGGVGGAPFYAPDFTKGSLRLPDLRGMYAEGAGFDNLNVGGVHGDAVREMTGIFHPYCVKLQDLHGVFYSSITPGGLHVIGDNREDSMRYLRFAASRVVPTANKNQPRAWGALPCVYLGVPR